MIRQLIATLLAAVALNAFAAVDVNQATRADLETVKGIGPAMSGKILKERESGSFKNWGDLVDRVGGIGPANAGKLSSGGLTVAGSSYDATGAAPAGKVAKAGKGDKADKADKAEKVTKGNKSTKDKKAAEAA